MAANQESDFIRLVFGGVACMISGFFTNPADVVKTRCQMAGELGKDGHVYKGVYRTG